MMGRFSYRNALHQNTLDLAGVLRDRTGESSGHSDLSELLNARQEWHAVLDDVLEGTYEDLEAIMSSARYSPAHRLFAPQPSDPFVVSSA